MRSEPLVLAVDQGTGSTRAVLVGADNVVRANSTVAVGLSSPKPGWVEQDPREIASSVVEALKTGIDTSADPVAAIGLSNQRESALAWDPQTGEPLGPVLTWQDRRTARRAEELAENAGRVRELSGLPLDPMFSALKFEWLLNEIDPDRVKARRGQIRLGTIDSWILHCLTGDDQIEAGNASRTQLVNVHSVDWDDELLDLFDVPRQALSPIVRSDSASSPIAGTSSGLDGIRITGVLGDSHAALFAHGIREPGSVKVTYGTGSSVMGLTSDHISPNSGLVETVGWQTDATARAFEGNILSTGGTLVWLGKLLDRTPDELAEMAKVPADHGGVNLVPAFAGLGAPWWDGNAQAVIDGFDLATDATILARAAMDSIALQIEDVLERADSASGRRVDTILADGGPAQNDWLMQMQSDISNRRLLRPGSTGLSAVGAGHMAGLGADLWTEADLAVVAPHLDEFVPTRDRVTADARRASWARAVLRSRTRSN